MILCMHYLLVLCVWVICFKLQDILLNILCFEWRKTWHVFLFCENQLLVQWLLKPIQLFLYLECFLKNLISIVILFLCLFISISLFCTSTFRFKKNSFIVFLSVSWWLSLSLSLSLSLLFFNCFFFLQTHFSEALYFNVEHFPFQLIFWCFFFSTLPSIVTAWS